MKLRHVILAVCAGVACGTAVKPSLSPIPIMVDTWEVQLVHDELYCEQDSDCAILERPDCCGCSAGGVQGPVRKLSLPDVEARLAAACGETACPDVISTDVTCVGVVPACVENTCHLMRQE